MPDSSSTGPCAMLYFALGVGPGVRIPKNKRTKAEVLQWALERYVAQGSRLADFDGTESK